jgi:hypothetical protein
MLRQLPTKLCASPPAHDHRDIDRDRERTTGIKKEEPRETTVIKKERVEPESNTTVIKERN